MQEVIMKSVSGLFLTQTEYNLLISAALLLGAVLHWFLTILILKLIKRHKELKKALPKDKHHLLE